MSLEILHVVLFIVGWVLFVLAQAQNSIRSSTNGLSGKNGWAVWFQAHAIELAVRAFVSGCFYGFILKTTEGAIEAAGLHTTATGIAGMGGFFANAVAYQITGHIPQLRVETADVAPPINPPLPPKEN